ncbi:MAG: o-succinylbenzoate--CoA ligase [Rubrobacter sp.]|nr:o-succinylbenzoate--CoA ligase [Rubrobacter sp.]
MTGRSGEKTVPCPLRTAALAAPDSPAVVGHYGEASFADLDRRATASARKLESLGLSDGAKVGVRLPKSAGQIFLILAAMRAGSVFVPISTRIPPEGIPPLLETAGCSAFVSAADVALRAAEGSRARPFRPEELLGDVCEPSSEGIQIPLDRPATIVFTSGSTGSPKAALHTFGNHFFSALGSNANIRLVPGDVWLHSLPLSHVGGLSILFRCLTAGATMAFSNPNSSVGRAIPEAGATHVSLVATQLRRLFDEDAPFDGVKAILLGGSAMPGSLLEEAHRRGLPVHTSYGLTEMSSQATTTRPGASLEELRTSGGPLPYREASVADGDGEILVRGETLFSGYVEGDGLSRPFDEDGWFHTKDLGRIDGEGRLTVLGRKDNLFISGGENIQPEAVEEEIRRAANVEDAVVVPISDDEFGYRPVAFVKGDVSPEKLRASLEAALPRFAVPVAFHAWPDDAPAEMKVDRGFFRERAEVLHRER